MARKIGSDGGPGASDGRLRRDPSPTTVVLRVTLATTLSLVLASNWRRRRLA
jgi:hypothetical protein